MPSFNQAIFLSACLGSFVEAAQDRIFLTASLPDSGQINFIEVYEKDNKATDLRQNGSWRPLITKLKYPTYTAYDFENRYLYVCDCDEVLQYRVSFVGDEIEAWLKGAILEKTDCGGLSVDKFNNLFYVDMKVRYGSQEDTQINKINRDLLRTEKYPVELKNVMYEGASSHAARNVRDIAIEKEYLYWTNDSHHDGHGGVHKAFTEPFIVAEPFQTYEIQGVNQAFDITTDGNYLFFTGQPERQNGQEDDLTTLFIQKKQGAGLYYHFDSSLTNKLQNPGSLESYKDSLLLIANEGFISMLDTTKFPPLSSDFLDQTIRIDNVNSSTSNSVCSQNALQTKAPRGLSFISKRKENVHK